MTNPVGQMSRRALFQSTVPTFVASAAVAGVTAAQAAPSHISGNSIRAYIARQLKAARVMHDRSDLDPSDEAMKPYVDNWSNALHLVFQGRVECREDAIAAIIFIIQDCNNFDYQDDRAGVLLLELARWLHHADLA